MWETLVLGLGLCLLRGMILLPGTLHSPCRERFCVVAAAGFVWVEARMLPPLMKNDPAGALVPAEKARPGAAGRRWAWPGRTGAPDCGDGEWSKKGPNLFMRPIPHAT